MVQIISYLRTLTRDQKTNFSNPLYADVDVTNVSVLKSLAKSRTSIANGRNESLPRCISGVSFYTIGYLVQLCAWWIKCHRLFWDNTYFLLEIGDRWPLCLSVHAFRIRYLTADLYGFSRLLLILFFFCLETIEVTLEYILDIFVNTIKFVEYYILKYLSRLLKINVYYCHFLIFLPTNKVSLLDYQSNVEECSTNLHCTR